MAEQKVYIITEEQLRQFEVDDYPMLVCRSVRSHPAISPQFNSTELLLIANDEWKRRQERKHLNDNPAWVSGFIGGFLTDKKWARDYVNNLISKGV